MGKGKRGPDREAHRAAKIRRAKEASEAFRAKHPDPGDTPGLPEPREPEVATRRKNKTFGWVVARRAKHYE